MPSNMKISINNRPYEVDSHRPLIDALRAAGFTVPTMCHAEGYDHHPSCMVCMVKDADTGQMIPSCSTMPREGMRIETDTDEVNELRRTALELLLSDHRADCEAPCTLVCKRGIDVAELIRLHDMGDTAQARALMEGKTCEGCPAPCERACRRGTVDKAVNIREITALYQSASANPAESRQTTGFNSRLGRFTDLEKKRLQITYTQPSHCLHCACAGKQDCKLRSLATTAGIKSPRYGNHSALTAKLEVPVTDHLVYEPAKCIRCGLCVYNTQDGFTFEGRGFGMRVVIREQSKSSITDEIARLLARLCPTGALVLKLLLPLLFLLGGCRSLPGDVEKDQHLAWGSFRGNSSLSGYTDCELPEHPTLLWERRHDVRTVASPLVHDGTVFICDKHGQMLGFDEQGEVVFNTPLESDVEASFVIDDSTIYIGQLDGEIRALSLSNGKERWKYPTEGQIKASPTITTIDDHDYLLVGSYDNNMYTLDASNGKFVGCAPTEYYINGAASLWHRYALFGGCDAWLRMVDAKTGEAVDSLQLEAYLPASPAIMGDYAYIADYQGNVYVAYLSGGKFRPHRKLLTAPADGDNMLSMPAVTCDAVYVLAEGRYLLCIDIAKGNIKWKQMLRGEVGESSPQVCYDRVIVCTRTGVVSIHDAATGKELWEYETGEQIISSPAVVDSRFYILTARGTLLCFGEKLDN